jgi:hypothetical protein
VLALSFLAAALVCGCSGSKVPDTTAEVTGTVTYNGKPVPGGMINFVATKGGYSGGGNIDENGNFKATTVPVGEVKITVDNSMLNRGRGVPAGGRGPGLKRPDAAGPEEVKGHYVDIPNKYANVDTSDLTYTVTKGAQKHDVELK